MKKLLLVDGSNIVMRAAFGGDIPPENSVPVASGIVSRAGLQIGATHMIVALDSPTPSWRKLEFPEYKAHRTRDTSPWFVAAWEYWNRIGWHVEDCGGFEADDIIATVAKRATCPVVILSNDSDLLALTSENVSVLKPLNGGQFALMTPPDVCEKYKLRNTTQLPDYKALIGEKGDNIPGVPGIGPARAAELLRAYDSIDGIISAPIKCKHAVTVVQHADTARRALKLVTLSDNAPIPLITSCLFSRH